MNDQAILTTSVTALVGLLREALTSLVPVAEKARIPWSDGKAYDDWDGIASSLYENIVVRSIKYAAEAPRDARMPKYDMLYPSYRDLWFISVDSSEIPVHSTAAFVGFAGTAPDFPSIKWIEITPTGDAVGEAKFAQFAECRFYLINAADKITRIETLTVEL